jgi:hypothetical protein
MKTEQLAEKIYKLTGLRFQVEGDNALRMEVDRGPRIDHGGGEDGDDWLDDHEVDELSDRYKEKHITKIERVKDTVTKLKVDCSVEFYYGEKGHCSIFVAVITRSRK